MISKEAKKKYDQHYYLVHSEEIRARASIYRKANIAKVQATQRAYYANGMPPGYQVLCWNCNSAKGLFGLCPHKYGAIKNAAY